MFLIEIQLFANWAQGRVTLPILLVLGLISNEVELGA